MIRRIDAIGIRRGAIAPLMAILIVFVLGMVAFAVDMGYIVLARAEAQKAADAAALAAVGKLADRLQSAPFVDGQPRQTQDDLNAARAEAKLFAQRNKVGSEAPDVKDAEIEFGYMSDPYNQGSNLDTTGWPTRPYNAARVTVNRDKDHTGGPLKLFFAAVFGRSTTDITATATTVMAMGTAKVKGNSGNRRGGLLPFTYQVDDWNAFINANKTGSVDVPGRSSITVSDNYNVNNEGTPPSNVTSGSDNKLETKLFPDRTTSGNFGTINFTTSKSGNSTSVLRDLIQNGPATSDWADLPGILKATSGSPVNVNGDPGISAGMESAVESIIGQPRILPLYKTVTGTGNNTFYSIVGFVPITIVAVDLNGGSKHITIQPRVANLQDLIDGSNRLDFDITPTSNPNSLFIGYRSLVR